MMTIGLVRHFEVIQDLPRKKWMNSIEFDAWIEKYDHSDVIITPSTIDSGDWDMCMSSDLHRAVVTSKQLYKDEVLYTEQLREIKIKSIFNTKIKFHYSFWLIIGRLTWVLINKSHPDGKLETMVRVREIVDRIEQMNVTKLLIVSHGALMWYIRKELRKRGYKGPVFMKPVNGKLYSFQKSKVVNQKHG